MQAIPSLFAGARRLLVPLSALILVSAGAAASLQAVATGTRPPAHAATALAVLLERYQDAQARLDPLNDATLRGDHRFDDQLPITIAPAQRQQRLAMIRRIQSELATIPRASLGPQDAFTRDGLARELQAHLGAETRHEHLLPLAPVDSVPVLLARLGSGRAGQPLETVAQYDAYLKRISQLPTWVGQAMANMREGMRRGVVPPQAEAAATLVQLLPLGSEKLLDNPFNAPIRRLSENFPGSFPEADRERLAAAYGEAIATRIAPALRKLATFMTEDYLPACRGAAAPTLQAAR